MDVFLNLLYPVLFLFAFLLSYLGVASFQRWSLKRNILDVPNERSSHKSPTPKGGGLIIAAICLGFFLFYQLFFTENFIWAYFFGAIIIVFISWLDDLYELSPIWRFLCHIFAAILVIFQNGFWEEIYIPILGNIHFGFFGAIISVFWIVWLINAYNFMDGIDGIAGVQSINASVGWAMLGYFSGNQFLFLYGLMIFASTLGFLVHNWQPAKIFMGDVGSAFLGYTFAVFPWLVEKELWIQKGLIYYVPILTVLFVWLFVFDSIFTLCKRLLKKEKVWKAHRSHLYQLLVIKNYSHSKVSIIYGILSFVILIAIYLYFLELFTQTLIIFLITIVTTILIFLVYDNKMLTK